MDITVKDLVVKYKDFTAVNGISFEVEKGRILAVIGPNGSGKTSTIECIEGLRKADSGKIRVLGMDPVRQHREIYKKIGIQLQEAQYQSRIKVYELCEQFSSFYDFPADYKSLLEQFHLEKKTRKYVSSLSGGEKQKLSIILALIPKPSVLFLDELTTGLDPEARRSLWSYIKDINSQGITVLMISHFMDEVEYLADNVLMLKDGVILETGTVNELKQKSGASKKVTFYASGSNDEILNNLKSIDGVTNIFNHTGQITVYGNGPDLGPSVSRFLEGAKYSYSNFSFGDINFEDVYLLKLNYRFNGPKGGVSL